MPIRPEDAEPGPGGTLSGWLQKLEKKGGLGKNKYRKCWFVLSRENNEWSLSHYEHGTNMREFVGAERLARGERKVAKLTDIKSVRFLGQKGNKFEVLFQDGSESLVLRAVNGEVCNRWVEALSDLLNIEPVSESKKTTEYTDYSLKKGNIDKRRERESIKVAAAFLQDSEIFMSSARKFTANIQQKSIPKSKIRTLERRRKNKQQQKDKLPNEDDSEVQDQEIGDIPPPPPLPSGQDESSVEEEVDEKTPDDGKQKSSKSKPKAEKSSSLGKLRCKKDKRQGSDMVVSEKSSATEEDAEVIEEEEQVDKGPKEKPEIPPPPIPIQVPPAPATAPSGPSDSKPKKKERSRLSLRLFMSHQASLDRPKAATIVSADTLKRKKNLSAVALSPKAFSGGIARKPVEKGPRLAVLPMMRSPQVESGLTDIKSEATKQLIKDTIDASFSLSGMLFHDLDQHAINELIDRMYRVDIRAKQDVIKQGHSGDKFYVISEGRFHFYTKRGEGEDTLPELIAENGPRTFFGELALLYEQPSPVTVRAVTDGVLWAISRQMFFEIRKAQARKRQGRKLRLLNGVDVLSDNLDEADLIALAEAVDERLYEEAGSVVVEEGKKLDRVIIVGAGVLDVLVKGVKKGELRAGDTFGEWALLERASKAEVKLVAGEPHTHILSLDVEEFEGLVGPLREVIKSKWAESVGEMFPGRKSSTRRPSTRKKTTGTLSDSEEFVSNTIKTIKERFSKRQSSYHRPARSTASSSVDSMDSFEDYDDDAKSAIVENWEKIPLPFADARLEDLEPLLLLGKGSFGRVHLVRSVDETSPLPDYMALKVLSRDYIQSHGWTSMVENERHAMAELGYRSKCPFIVKLLSAFYDRRNVFFLMELLDGGDLYALLRKQEEPRVSEKDAKFYIAAISEALEAVHERGILYRDLKPENLFLCHKGYPRLADFGLAKKTARSYTVCGTPDYMAPEIILGRGHDNAVDWWAVGVFIFEITTGVTPFCGRDPMDIYESVLAHEDGFLVFPDFAPLSKECKSIISKLLNPKKSKRVATVRAGLSQHPWFDKFKWNELREMTLKPPLTVRRRDVSRYEMPGFFNTYDAKLRDAAVDNSSWVPNV